MSHLTLAGRKCKVAGKQYKCIFHGKSSLRGTRSKREISRTVGKSGYRTPVKGRRRTGGRAMPRDFARGVSPDYIPRWDSIRKGVDASSRTTKTKRGTRSTDPWRARLRDQMHDWVEEMSRKGGFMELLR